MQFKPAFGSFPYDSQKVFRLLLNAQAYPGTIQSFDFKGLFLSPPPLDAGAAALLLTLCDYDTGIYLSPSVAKAEAYLSFHTGARISGREDSSFAVYGSLSELGRLSDHSMGSESYPDRSATLVVSGALKGDGPDLIASGPGIKELKLLRGHGLSRAFVEERSLALSCYPLGVDVFLTSPDSVLALPRTTRLELKAG
jgi:alpha-D-ribose 1-methylphosphonate 5-triphosphate synthase subunit PhnH